MSEVKIESESERFSGYDFIGDVHGCAKTLVRLLENMDYRKVNGVYQHKDRQAIFVGDIVDRGPRIREALHLVRDMVEHGAARIVMGNHEYNALGYCTLARPGSNKAYLREHTPRHERVIRETLEQFANYGHEWNHFLEWFMTLPILIDTPEFRVVHACWDHGLIESFLQAHPDAVIDEDFLHASTVRESFAGHVMDRLLRGTDMPLPKGLAMKSGDGYVRTFFRTKFWAEDPDTYDDVVFQPDGLPEAVKHRPLADSERERLVFYGPEEPPLFVGHYWLSGHPRPVRQNIACLDYSAVKYGKLAAYRMNGERVLKKENFVWVDVSRDISPEAGLSY
ncbi:serine/threonine protein phosphatase [Hahella sp. CCB-MM4]|uniref:metallophosphoesterase n=1 Tax=Hahella sp. (strain CCB-MM4) TaxID=1926491 RepID=UPI000B9A1CD0|nr:metallophosphoesterase [Hahella sp. CCB-MM4]OZG74010.1 serine/threonine protein phosphatase [Hahella sp. CCB-MM4]